MSISELSFPVKCLETGVTLLSLFIHIEFVFINMHVIVIVSIFRAVKVLRLIGMNRVPVSRTLDKYQSMSLLGTLP